MTRIRIDVFDPALCCSTGVCGPEVDDRLVTFAADAAWAGGQGADLTRRNLAQEPLAFAGNDTVARLLHTGGESALPVVLLNGELALAGRYPTRRELARWLGQEDVGQAGGLNGLTVLGTVPDQAGAAPGPCGCAPGEC